MPPDRQEDAGRIVLAGGGTGGHIFLGQAVVEAMRKRMKIQVLFVGTRRGLESRVLVGDSMDLEFIDVRGLKGTGFGGTWRALTLLPRALRQSAQILKRYQPRLAIGLGGYSAGPVLLQASRMKIATLIIEPNVLPGAANRWLRRWTDAAAVAFEETRDYLGKKCQLTGVPVRTAFFEGQTQPRQNDRFQLLVFGGSQGSRRLNELVTEALPFLKAGWKEVFGRLEIVHQTGDADCTWVNERYRRSQTPAEVVPFLADMAREMALANLVLCRAGAGTVAELCAVGRAAVLVPFPQAADQHQLLNARALQRRGAARLAEEKDLSAESLANLILELASDPELRSEMEQAAGRLARPDAADRIAEMACRLMERQVA